MTNESLARSYLRKASDRIDVLDLLLKKGAGIVTKVERSVLRYVPDLSIGPSMQKTENK